MGTALVTGAGRGIGLEFAKQLLAAGHRVVGTARDPKKYSSFDELAASGSFLPRQLDVASVDSIEGLASALRGALNALGLIVNCAGINSMSNAPYSKESSLRLGSLEQGSLLNQFRVNAVGPVLLVQALLPLLEGAADARVLNVSSWLGSIGCKSSGGNYGYCASKAALNMMNRALAEDLRERGILCVVMNPGWVQTDMGGAKATLSPSESVAGMLRTLTSLKPEDTGGFLQWDGSTHPW